jgi:hypothetical protein
VTSAARFGTLQRMSDVVNIERDVKGRFLSGGKAGPGRPVGSRNRHTENFLREFADDFERHGAAVIAKVREEKPDVYLRIAADLLPREATLDVSVDVDVRAQVVDLLEVFRNVNGGRVDGELEKMAKRLLPKLIDVHPAE